VKSNNFAAGMLQA